MCVMWCIGFIAACTNAELNTEKGTCQITSINIQCIVLSILIIKYTSFINERSSLKGFIAQTYDV